METIQIPLSLFAGYASIPIRGRDRRAAEIKGMLSTAYDPAKDYWKKPREAIRRSAAARNIRGLGRVKFTSSDPSRVSNYETAIREFSAWWRLFGPSSVGDPGSAAVAVSPFDVVVSPDLRVMIGGLGYLVRIRFTKGMQLLPPERLVTTSLIWEGFQGSLPAILDLETGEFSSRPGSDREILEKVAADLASRWPSD